MPETKDNLQSSDQKELQRLVDQIERLEAEKVGLQADIRDKYAEAKNLGYDAKILRKIIALRKKSEADRAEEEALMTTYMAALGMLADTPLGQFAMDEVRTARAKGSRQPEAVA